MIEIMVTLVLCRTVISMDNIVVNSWLTGMLVFLVVELYGVSKTGIMEHVVRFLLFDNVPPNSIHLL